MAIRFTAINEVIDYVKTALGCWSVNYDVETIAYEIVECSNGALYLLPDFEADECGCSDDFWALVDAYVLE